LNCIGFGVVWLELVLPAPALFDVAIANGALAGSRLSSTGREVAGSKWITPGSFSFPVTVIRVDPVV
jgi:hypothetical protein